MSRVNKIRVGLSETLGSDSFPNWIGPQRFGSTRPVTPMVGMAVLEGDFECGKMSKVHAPPEAVEKGEVLACRIYPLTDLTIECVLLPEAALAKQTITKPLR